MPKQRRTQTRRGRSTLERARSRWRKVRLEEGGGGGRSFCSRRAHLASQGRAQRARVACCTCCPHSGSQSPSPTPRRRRPRPRRQRRRVRAHRRARRRRERHCLRGRAGAAAGRGARAQQPPVRRVGAPPRRRRRARRAGRGGCARAAGGRGLCELRSPRRGLDAVICSSLRARSSLPQDPLKTQTPAAANAPRKNKNARLRPAGRPSNRRVHLLPQDHGVHEHAPVRVCVCV